MRPVSTTIACVFLMLVIGTCVEAQQSTNATAAGSTHIWGSAKVYIEKMDGFEEYLIAALHKKQVPVVVVTDKDKADFVFTGTAWSHGKRQQATIKAVSKDGVVAYAFAFDDDYTLHGKRSAAEACAKDLKKEVFEH